MIGQVGATTARMIREEPPEEHIVTEGNIYNQIRCILVSRCLKTIYLVTTPTGPLGIEK